VAVKITPKSQKQKFAQGQSGSGGDRLGEEQRDKAAERKKKEGNGNSKSKIGKGEGIAQSRKAEKDELQGNQESENRLYGGEDS